MPAEIPQDASSISSRENDILSTPKRPSGIGTQGSPAGSDSSIDCPEGSPLRDDVHGFSFNKLTNGANMHSKADPLEELRDDLKHSSINQVYWKLYPPGLFTGLKNERQVGRTVKRWLEDVFADSRTHIELANDSVNLCIHDLCPAPIAKAIRNICLSQGWHAETLVHTPSLCGTSAADFN